MLSGISAIVPVYNTAAYLRRCVDSLLAQTLAPAEIILVDDGSSDQSGDLCDQYAAQWPGMIRVIHQQNAGPSVARNTGIDAASGAYLSFIDSDDYLEPDAFERLTQALGGADMVCGEMIVEKPDGGVYCQNRKDVHFQWSAQEALIELCSYRYLRFSCCAALYQRHLFDGLRFPPGTLCEDYYLQYQLIAASRSVVYTSRPVYRYFQRPRSRSRTAEVSLAPLGASDAQLAFFQARFPSIAWAAESDCVFARMGIYTAYIRNGAECPPALLKTLRSAAGKYLWSVLKHPRLPNIKKLQALAFCFFPPVYRFVIARTEHR